MTETAEKIDVKRIPETLRVRMVSGLFERQWVERAEFLSWNRRGGCATNR
jgi:hypothetical protein